VQTAGEKRQAAVQQAEAIIDAGVQSFAHWLDQRAAVPLIQALNRQADDWGAVELARARKQLAKGESVDQVLEALARGLTHKMLHGTLAELHSVDGPEREQLAHTVSRLFLRGSSRTPGGDRPLAPATSRRPLPAGDGSAAPAMTPSLREQFERLAMRLASSTPRLADPQVSADIKRYRSCRANRPRPPHVVGLFRRYQQREADLAAARRCWPTPPRRRTGRPWRATRSPAPRPTSLRLDAELQAALLPRDPDDERNAFLEIRAGTGGDESALFAGDLARMYLRFCERQGWRTEVLSEKPAELGGYKELVLRVEGDGAYGRCASSPAATACSACRPPRRRAASTPAPARWP
jgi:hypothetical protein